MLGLCLSWLQGDEAALPRVEVTQDDTILDRSCRVFIPEGTLIPDANGNGVLQIGTSGITVVFEPGSRLRGAPEDTPWDQLQGYGVRIRDAVGVSLHGAALSGYRAGVWASAAPDLLLEDLQVTDYFRQRLRSRDEAEDGGDWLWPHNNDANEWLANYGAAVYVEDSDGVTVRRLRARRGQNGICLDRVNGARVYDNDCSFLSGWGLALWRSSRNVVSRNAFDFCVRGYSHGVYSRGQDSAGILMFEQCSNNIIAENSATHSGDGFFGFAGREALGEAEAPQGFRHEGAGHRDNLLIGNDFSDAPAIGIEMTFSFGNRFVDNRLSGGNYGVWAGYSQDTLVAGNEIEDNAISGVAIEHGSGNRILANRFARNARGVELWWDVDAALFATPWVKANHKGCVGNQVAHNSFAADRVAVELRRTGEHEGVSREMSTTLAGNRLEGVEQGLRVLDDAVPPAIADEPEPVWERPQYAVFGETRPVNARAALRGREHIVMTDWGPWDHESPLARRAADLGSAHQYRLHGMAGRPQCALADAPEGVTAAVEADAGGGPGDFLLRIAGASPGLHPYRVRVEAANFSTELSGTLVVADWEVTAFSWTEDPRSRLDAWRAQAQANAITARLPGLRLRYGHGGPELGGKTLPPDRFGTLARASLPLPAGRYRIVTVSDDGVRVFVNGQQFIEHWDVHAPARDQAEFELAAPAEVEIRVEHFENDGYAQLELDIEPLR
ncbi:MAG: hypothetical protein EYC70_00030 [Planctomycetota bacterium]|nr:MAG: hypothetical protein EYC70_00030 [Planctomycetota bacterium]